MYIYAHIYKYLPIYIIQVFTIMCCPNYLIKYLSVTEYITIIGGLFFFCEKLLEKKYDRKSQVSQSWDFKFKIFDNFHRL